MPLCSDHKYIDNREMLTQYEYEVEIGVDISPDDAGYKMCDTCKKYWQVE